MLFYYAPVAILIALLSVTASMLQGIDKQKLTVFVILASVVMKIILNTPLIVTFHSTGAILSTAIALLFAVICNFYILKNMRNLIFRNLVTFRKKFMYGFIMMIAVELTFLFCNYSFQQNQKLVR